MLDAFGQPQTLLLLGGTSEIGLATAEQLIAARVRQVVLAGRDAARLEEAAEHLRACGASQVDCVVFDAEDPSTAARCIETAVGLLGGQVDLTVVAVGFLGSQPDLDDDPVATARSVTVNFTWPAAALAALRPRLLAQGAARVVVLSSVAGVRVRRANATYGSAKAGLDAYARTFGESLRGTGVVVQVVRPGFVHSKMTEGLPPAPMATSCAAVATAICEGLGSTTPVLWVPAKLKVVFFVLRHLPQAIFRRLPG